VVNRTPGLKAKKRDAGIATFGEVISGSMVNILSHYFALCVGMQT